MKGWLYMFELFTIYLLGLFNIVMTFHNVSKLFFILFG